MAVSKMLEGFCADIEDLLPDGQLRQAVRHALALPEICSALEDAAVRGLDESYLAWCARWLKFPHGKDRVPVGARLLRLHRRSGSNIARWLTALRVRRNARSYRGPGRAQLWHPANRLEAFEAALCLTLVDAARRWYAEHGRTDRTVQVNLGKLLIAR
ncbi:MAG TPA: hypothetical protein VGT07_15130 [Steroidobacteraceae bacterium]|nr:hypothetical protein [Steroidobacteraceae bacterium]